MAVPYNSGTIGYGSLVLTINSVAYVAEDISLSLPTQELLRYDELNAPEGIVLTEDFASGSATLQLATTSTVLPIRGQTFTANLQREASSGTQTYVITQVDPSFAQGDFQKVSINFRQVPE